MKKPTANSLLHSKFKVMLFGLCNAPATFKRLMDVVLTGLQWSSFLVYLDDIIIVGRNFSDHLQNINLIFQEVQEAGLKLQTPKCKFFWKSHILGSCIVPAKVDIVRHWPTLQNPREVQ